LIVSGCLFFSINTCVIKQKEINLNKFKNIEKMKNSTLNEIRTKKMEQEIEKKVEFKNFIEQVKKEMILTGVYYKKAKFQCFNDNMFTYGYSNHSAFFEFTITCDDTLLDKMTIKDLLELKNIQWFDNRIFCKQTMEVLGNISYSALV
jgi:hypothetical protein